MKNKRLIFLVGLVLFSCLVLTDSAFAYQASISVTSSDKTVVSGSPIHIKAEVTNNGSITWIKNAFNFRPHVYLPNGAYIRDYPGEGYTLPHDVRPGESVIMNLEIPTGGSLGRWVIGLDMVHEWVRWFRNEVQVEVNVVEVYVPHLMRFQGMLKDASKTPLDGTYAVTFRLYDKDAGGSSIWQETHKDITIEEGILDVELGSITPLDLPSNTPYYLGVEVESDGEMTPRFKLTTVPYAFNSER